MNNTADFFWLIGILEGEGYFTYSNGTHRFGLKMVDEDIVRRVAWILEDVIQKPIDVVERVNGTKDTHQDTFNINLSGDSARRVLRAIVPYMGFRRRRQIWQALNSYKAKKHKVVFDAGLILSGLKEKVNG